MEAKPKRKRHSKSNAASVCVLTKPPHAATSPNSSACMEASQLLELTQHTKPCVHLTDHIDRQQSLSIYPSIYLSLSLSLHLSIYLSLSLSLYRSILRCDGVVELELAVLHQAQDRSSSADLGDASPGFTNTYNTCIHKYISWASR